MLTKGSYFEDKMA